MRKTIAIIIITLIILGIVSYFRYEVRTRILHETKNALPIKKLATTSSSVNNNDVGYKDSTYMLDGQLIRLINGQAENEIIAGSDAKVITSYFGNEVKGDFNVDGREDIAFLLSQQTAGTGIFFYLVVALNTPTGYVGSHGYFIGDRIAPQSTQLGEGSSIIVNYADRVPGEPFTTDPTVGKSIKLILDPESMVLSEVVKTIN